MCLTIKEKMMTPTSPSIADKDILCYKYMYAISRPKTRTVYATKIKSPFRGHVWTVKKEERAILRRTGTSVTNGLHAYKELSTALGPQNGSTVKRIALCIIPKGAKYYEGQLDIVANRMKITKIMTQAEARLLYQQQLAATQPQLKK